MNVFNRAELKYLITIEQYEKLKTLLNKKGYYLDKYGKSTIQSLYYDTEDDVLINRSLDKPIFKEKIRVRNYGQSLNEKVYIELKRKFKGEVYKRRIETNYKDLELFFDNKLNYDSQIGKEINSFRDQYVKLIKKYLIICEREAYYNKESDLRFTIDFDIRYRKTNLNFDNYKDGLKILKENNVLLEIKSSFNFPLWLVEFLNNNNIYKTNFSKYGTAYLLNI